jgi:hypothetical protein
MISSIMVSLSTQASPWQAWTFLYFWVVLAAFIIMVVKSFVLRLWAGVYGLCQYFVSQSVLICSLSWSVRRYVLSMVLLGAMHKVQFGSIH